MNMSFKRLLSTCSVALVLSPAAALAEIDEPVYTDEAVLAEREERELSGAREDVQESAQVVQQMKQDENLLAAFAQAKGVFIVPDYGSASLVIGGSGGEGVLIRNEGGQWGSPLFYDIGQISFGAQAGIEAGSIAMLLMTDRAVESFAQENNFSLNAEAGLTLINWSVEAEASVGKGDVILWSDVEGLLAEAAIGVSDINFDEEETREYYNDPTLTLEVLMAGDVEDPNQELLETEFAEFSTVE